MKKLILSLVLASVTLAALAAPTKLTLTKISGGFILDISDMVVGQHTEIQTTASLTAPVIWTTEISFTAGSTSGQLLFPDTAGNKFFRVMQKTP